MYFVWSAHVLFIWVGATQSAKWCLIVMHMTLIQISTTFICFTDMGHDEMLNVNIFLISIILMGRNVYRNSYLGLVSDWRHVIRQFNLRVEGRDLVSYYWLDFIKRNQNFKNIYKYSNHLPRIWKGFKLSLEFWLVLTNIFKRNR